MCSYPRRSSSAARPQGRPHLVGGFAGLVADAAHLAVANGGTARTSAGNERFRQRAGGEKAADTVARNRRRSGEVSCTFDKGHDVIPVDMNRRRSCRQKVLSTAHSIVIAVASNMLFKVGHGGFSLGALGLRWVVLAATAAILVVAAVTAVAL